MARAGIGLILQTDAFMLLLLLLIIDVFDIIFCIFRITLIRTNIPNYSLDENCLKSKPVLKSAQTFRRQVHPFVHGVQVFCGDCHGNCVNGNRF